MISELFAMYQFGAIHTVDITDSKVTNQPPGVPLNLRYSDVYTCPYSITSSVFIYPRRVQYFRHFFVTENQNLLCTHANDITRTHGRPGYVLVNLFGDYNENHCQV